VERMNPLDTWFLHVEDEADHMHIGSVGIFEEPAPAYDELLGAIASKLALLPRYRQRFQTVPFGLARPVWVDDPHFRLEYHVRHTALPSPGGDEQLRNLVGRVMGQQLDRHRPLWETWFIEGLPEGRWGMLTKVHHCLVDGVGGTDLLATLLDATPEAAAADFAPGSGWGPAPAPSSRQLVSEAVRELATQPSEQWRVVRARLRRPRAALRNGLATASGFVRLAGVTRPTPRTSLNGPIGPHRRWVTADASLGDAKYVRRRLGGTVNDVVLAAITNGFRALLAERGELTETAVVRTMVPVSIRPQDSRATHNHVTALFVELPVAEPDPVERLGLVRARMEGLKRSGEHAATSALVDLSGVVPPLVLGTAMRTTTRVLQRVGQRFVTTVTTNVPGPQIPLYLLGRRMVAAYPYVPIGEALRIGVAIFSYDGALTFGVTGDYDTTEDLDVLADGIAAGFDELTDAARHAEPEPVTS
jgi:diacylglycerol O-acyltransferase / wax synthase